MARNLLTGTLATFALVAIGAGAAHAITFNLRWQYHGGCVDNATSCTARVGDIVVLDVQFIINVSRLFTSTSVGLDLSAMGLANTAVVGQGFSSGLPGQTTFTLNGVVNGGPANALAAAETNCVVPLPGCDHKFTSFGFLVPVSAGSGLTYTAGTISLDLSGAIPGTYTIITYQAAGVDGPTHNACNPHNVATLTIEAIPEPGTASLLGLGVLGLGLASRRRRGAD